MVDLGNLWRETHVIFRQLTLSFEQIINIVLNSFTRTNCRKVFTSSGRNRHPIQSNSTRTLYFMHTPIPQHFQMT